MNTLSTPSTAWPTDPIAAVTHLDPYPYYASLVDGPPLVFDARLKVWIAARASVVESILSDPRCRVRPTSEPVPAAIAGGSAGEVFSRLVRMNEGTTHAAPKLALQRALAAIDSPTIVRTTRHIVETLGPQPRTPTRLSAWIFELPVSVVASLLGFPTEELPQVVAWMRDFVACLSPSSSAAQIADAHEAAARLMVRMKSLLDATQAGAQDLVVQVAREAKAAGWDQADAIVCNLIGLLSQTHDATAGLIGNGIVAFHRQPGLHEQLASNPLQMRGFVEEVMRHDPSVQNTRRFVAEDLDVEGTALHAGDAILLVLAAANRDPRANEAPAEFRIDRLTRRVFSFGHARHACPGQALARTIASTALEAMANASTPSPAWRYRPSANARIPEFIDLALQAESSS